MSGRFFTKQKCARCSGLLASGRIQSMHDDPTLCMGARRQRVPPVEKEKSAAIGFFHLQHMKVKSQVSMLF